jgi:GNAT superfamily N-acetyltransferase
MLHLRPMTAADLPLGLRLSRQAGWNQLEEDWRRFVELQPDGGFVAEWDGTPAGTVRTLRFGAVAWIAMMLVEESLRGRGIGRALMTHALDYLDRQGVATIRLDATPLGQPLYERLGFREQFRLARYQGSAPPTPLPAGVETAAPDQWDALAELDQVVTATERRPLLHRLFIEQPTEVCCVTHEGRVVGYRAARPGARAHYLGPCIATPEAGPLLFADAWHHHARAAIFMDIPLANVAATALAEAHGLTVQRHLTRMCRGVPVCERVEHLWASAGPEKG